MASIDLNDDEKRRQYDSFVANNPGDEGRASSALGFDASGYGATGYRDQPKEASVSNYSSIQAPRGSEDSGDPFQHYPDETQGGIPPPNSPGGGGSASGPSAYTYRPGDVNTNNPYVDGMINRDRASWEASLKAAGGSLYDKSDLEGLIRQISYKQNAGHDPLEFIKQQQAIYDARRAPTASAGGTGGDADKDGLPGIDPGWVKNAGGQYVYAGTDPRTATTTRPPGGGTSGPGGYNSPGVDYPSYQFNDPYTQLLEQIGKRQIDSLTGQNPQMAQLMDFLNKRFGELSTSQGYSPDEMAILNTQALEPIEALRKASQQRELERTARAGYLPSSGITLDQQQKIDTGSDQMRTAANRDLTINSINKRNLDQNQALQLAQMGLSIPQQQNAQALDVANVLYQLPRQAMMDANTIVNGASPTNVLSPYIQLLQQQQSQRNQQQQQDAQFWATIGQQILGLFGGQ